MTLRTYLPYVLSETRVESAISRGVPEMEDCLRARRSPPRPGPRRRFSVRHGRSAHWRSARQPISVVLGADPVASIAAIRQIEVVIRDGRVVWRR